MYILLAYSTPVNILLTALILAVSVSVIWLMMRSIKRAQSNLMESDKDFQFNAEKFDIMLTKKLQSSRRANFTIFQLEIHDYQNLNKTLGEMQYNSAINDLIAKLKVLTGTTFRIFKYDDSIMLYSKYFLNEKAIKETAKNIIIECQKSIILAGALAIELDVNVGIVSYPSCGKTLEEVKQNLSIALVSAKRKGINTFGEFDAQLANKQTEEYKNYLEIKNAINNKEFALYYQPIIKLENGEVRGAEILLRWEHKTLGTLAPSSFLKIMEQSGDINWVGFWSFETLIKQSLQWKTNYPDIKIVFSMNLSPKQLMNADLIEEIRRIVKRYRINTSEYCMEIVQFAMFDKIENIQGNINRLSQMGFKIAIDNFGIDFSTLQALEKLKFDIIKLDKNFIKQAKEKEMTKSIIDLLIKYSKDKNIKLVAEGIEDIDVLENVKKLGIPYGQGYYFARPKRPKEFIQDVILTPWND